MRSARIVLATLVLCCGAARAEQAYRTDLGGGALRLLAGTAGSAFGVLCAAGRCALVLYPADAAFANGDALRVAVTVDDGRAQIVDGTAFEDRGGVARGGLGVAFRADETLAAALAAGRTARIAVARGPQSAGQSTGRSVGKPTGHSTGQRVGAGERFDLVGLARALARIAAPEPVRDVVRYD